MSNKKKWATQTIMSWDAHLEDKAIKTKCKEVFTIAESWLLLRGKRVLIWMNHRDFWDGIPDIVL